MKVLMVHKYHYFRGGDSTYMFNLSGLLEENGHEVAHFAMRHPKNLESPYSGYFTEEIDFPRLLENITLSSAWKVVSRSIYNREAAKKIAALADDFRPDVAHFHNIHGHLTTSIIEPLRKRRIPIVWTLHDYRLVCPNTSFLCRGKICERCLPAKYYNVLVHRCKKGSAAASLAAMLASYYERMSGVPEKIDRFIAPSAFMKKKLVEGGVDPDRISRVPNFVDIERFQPRGEKEEDYFLYFGRLSAEKGLDLLIEAAGGLEKGRLVIAGEGPLREKLEKTAEDIRGCDVEFAGFKPRGELAQLIRRSMFVVIPSQWYENLPFSVMESMALGKAVAATDIGGIPEMVEHGVSGYLFPPGDSNALAGRLEELLSSPEIRKKMGLEGRRKARELYGPSKHYDEIIAIYERVREED